MKGRFHKKADKLQPKRIARSTGKSMRINPSPQVSKVKGQEGSIKVRACIGGRSYEASISDENLRRAWRAIMIEEEE